jgi:hypothetical protein
MIFLGVAYGIVCWRRIKIDSWSKDHLAGRRVSTRFLTRVMQLQRIAIGRSTGSAGRRDIPLREKLPWRMLYRTTSRATAMQHLNVEGLNFDMAAPVRSRVGTRPPPGSLPGTGSAPDQGLRRQLSEAQPS